VYERTSLDTCDNVVLTVVGITVVGCIKQVSTTICACACVCVCLCINPRHLGYSAVVPFLAYNTEDLMLKVIYFTYQKMLQNNFASVYRKTHDPTCFVCVLLPALFFYLKAT